jgi:hypothetical protein
MSSLTSLFDIYLRLSAWNSRQERMVGSCAFDISDSNFALSLVKVASYAIQYVHEPAEDAELLL